MGFIDNVLENFGIADSEISAPYKIVIYGDKAGYFENISAIKEYAENEVTLCIKKGGLIVKGQGLYIKKYCDGDVVICGKICSIERV